MRSSEATLCEITREEASKAVPWTDASYRSIAATRSPSNLWSVPVAENLTHLFS
jgi:hypothetical protein